MHKLQYDCMFQEYCASLQYINEMPDPQTISGEDLHTYVHTFKINACAGIFGLLWCLKFEAIVVKSIDNFKRVRVPINISLIPWFSF